jgi:hypothetical protein
VLIILPRHIITFFQPSENQENFKKPEVPEAVPNVLNSDILQQAIAQSGLQNGKFLLLFQIIFRLLTPSILTSSSQER